MSDRRNEVDLQEIREALERGQKIEAIKLYRESTGAGLAEAKRAVEALMAQWPSLASGPGKTSPSSGCFGVLVIFAAAVSMLAW